MEAKPTTEDAIRILREDAREGVVNSKNYYGGS